MLKTFEPNKLIEEPVGASVVEGLIGKNAAITYIGEYTNLASLEVKTERFDEVIVTAYCYNQSFTGTYVSLRNGSNLAQQASLTNYYFYGSAPVGTTDTNTSTIYIAPSGTSINYFEFVYNVRAGTFKCSFKTTGSHSGWCIGSLNYSASAIPHVVSLFFSPLNTVDSKIEVRGVKYA